MESYEQVIRPVINRWKQIIDTSLVPVINKNSGGYLEGNIYAPEYYAK